MTSQTTSWLIEAQPEIRSRIMLWCITSFVLCFFVWASFAEIDELTRGTGKVIPSQKVQMIQNLEGGIVSELLVQEGSLVEQGQVLLRIDDTLFESNFRERQLKLRALQVRAARLKAEADGARDFSVENEVEAEVPQQVAEEKALFMSRLAGLENAQKVIDQQIKIQQQQMAQARFNKEQALRQQALAQKELDILVPLFKEGVVSEVEMLRAEKALLNAKGEASNNEFKIPQIETGIAELEDKRSQEALDFQSDAQQELAIVLAELSQLSESKGALQDRVARTQVRSPVNGTVKQLLVNTVGGVVQPGMDIVSIVPIEDSLKIEVKIKPSDIARLYPGQVARVKFTAYDFAIYGGLDARVETISADSITDEQGDSYYHVKVRTEQNFLGREKEPLPIIPGMIAQVDILTGKKTVLDYLLKPVFKAKDIALTEQ